MFKRKYIILFIIFLVSLLLTSCKNGENITEYNVRVIVENTVVSTFTVKEGEKFDSPTPIEKEGYSFVCWNLNGEKYNFNQKVEKNITLEAVYTKNKYTLTLQFDNGDADYVQYIYYGEPIEKVENPIKVNYIFLSWSEEIPTTMPSHDITVKALYRHDDYKINIVYNDGVTDDKVIKVAPGATIGEIEDPVRTGYIFDGWNVEIPATMPENDITIEAKWKKQLYTLFVYDYYGDGMNFQTQFDFEDKIVLDEPDQEGYQFQGYYTQANGTGEKIELSTMPAENMKIYAYWVEVGYKFKVVFNNNTEDYVAYYHYNETIASFTEPTKTGYVIDRWSDTIPTKMPKHDVTIYCYWKKATYKITIHNYNEDGTDKVFNLEYETKIKIENPTRKGYTFEYYSSQANGEGDKVTFNLMGGNDIEVYANYKLNQYQLVIYDYQSDGKALAVNYKYDDTISVENPTRYGYEFIGFSSDKSGKNPITFDKMGEENIIAYANWKIGTYKLVINNYYLDGSSIEGTFEYLSAINIPEPSHYGYQFMGYTVQTGGTEDKIELKTMVGSDIVVNANFDVGVFELTIHNYNPDGTSLTVQKEYNTEIGIKNPTRIGYEFSGYVTKFENGEPIALDMMFGENKTIYATWKIGNYVLTIKNYYSNGTDLTKTYNYKEKIEIINPSKADYIFKGFYSNSNGSGETYTLSTMPGNNTTIYAIFNPIEYNITYQLDGGTNSENAITKYSIENGKFDLPIPTKNLYNFKGWYLEDTFDTAISSIQSTARKDYTLYAKWEYDGYAKKPSVKNSYTYNGSVQSIEWNNIEEKKYTITGTYESFMDAGTYVTTFKLKEGYKWEDESTEDYVYSWTVAKYDLATALTYTFNKFTFATSFVNGMNSNFTYSFDWFYFVGDTITDNNKVYLGKNQNSYHNKSLQSKGNHLAVTVTIMNIDTKNLEAISYTAISPDAVINNPGYTIDYTYVCLYLNESLTLSTIDGDYKIVDFDTTNAKSITIANDGLSYTLSSATAVNEIIPVAIQKNGKTWYYSEIQFRAIDSSKQMEITFDTNKATRITQSDIGKGAVTYIPTHVQGVKIDTIATHFFDDGEKADQYKGIMGSIYFYNSITNFEEACFYLFNYQYEGSLYYIGTSNELTAAIGGKVIGNASSDLTAIIKNVDPMGGETISIKYDYDGACLVKGTLITLANGTTKKVEDITYSDLLLVKDLINGGYTYEYPSWIEKGNSISSYTLITFDDGETLKVVGPHSLFDLDKMTFVDNGVDLAVGARILKTKVDAFGCVTSYASKVVSIEQVNETVEYYHIFTAAMMNLISDNVVTTFAADYLLDYYGYIDCSSDNSFDIIMDPIKRAEIMSNPDNLYIYEDLAASVPYSIFVGFRGEETKVMVDNGVLTYEEWLAYLKNVAMALVKDMEVENTYYVCTSNDFEAVTVLEGSTYTLGEATEINGKTFIGWRNNVTQEMYQAGDSVEIYCSTCFIAIYQ